MSDDGFAIVSRADLSGLRARGVPARARALWVLLATYCDGRKGGGWEVGLAELGREHGHDPRIVRLDLEHLIAAQAVERRSTFYNHARDNKNRQGYNLWFIRRPWTNAESHVSDPAIPHGGSGDPPNLSDPGIRHPPDPGIRHRSTSNEEDTGGPPKAPTGNGDETADGLSGWATRNLMALVEPFAARTPLPYGDTIEMWKSLDPDERAARSQVNGGEEQAIEELAEQSATVDPLPVLDDLAADRVLRPLLDRACKLAEGDGYAAKTDQGRGRIAVRLALVRAARATRGAGGPPATRAGSGSG